MANSNQQSGFVDKHIEKVFLGLGVVVLLYAVSQFGLSTPRRLPVMGESVPPKKVDEIILDNARSLERRVLAVEPEPVEQREDLARLEAQQQSSFDEQLARVSYGSPLARGLQSKAIDTEFKPVTVAELRKVMPAPSRPGNWAGVELVITGGSGRASNDPVDLVEQPVWRAASVYPWQSLQERWNEAMKNVLVTPRLIALRYEVEVEVLAGDGSWKPVEDLSYYRAPNPQTGQPYAPPALPEYTGENTAEIREALLARQNDWTRYMLQPEFVPIWEIGVGEGSWRSHFPFELLDVFPKPETEMTDQATPRHGAAAVPGGVVPPRGAVPGRRTTRRSAVPRDVPGPDMMGPGRGAADSPDSQDKPALPEIPPLADQLQAGKVLMWFHATKIRFGQTYRCRFRLILANPLLGEPEAVPEDQGDNARQQTIASPWSPWSEPVAVEQQVEFFLTGMNPVTQKLKVTIFTRVLGQVVQYSQSSLAAGQNIGVSDVAVQVIDPSTSQPISRQVDFQTGATAIDFVFDRKVVSDLGAIREDGIELIYLGRDGVLARRLLQKDNTSETYAEFKAQAEQTRRNVTGEPDPAERARDERTRPDQPRRPTVPGGAFPPGVDPGMMDPGMAPGRR